MSIPSRRVDPTNAILYYAHAVLEGQTRQAFSAAGFDLACGFLHAGRRGLDALDYDMMELARPAVDDRVLTFLQSTTFHAGDVTCVSDGSCRMHPLLAGGLPMPLHVLLWLPSRRTSGLACRAMRLHRVQDPGQITRCLTLSRHP